MKDTPRKNHNAREPRRLRPVINWSDVPGDLIRDFVHALTDAGCAVTLGKTSKGDTLSMVALAGDQRPRGYAVTLSEVPFEMSDVLWELDIEVPKSIQAATETR